MKRQIICLMLLGVTFSGYSQQVLTLDQCRQMAVNHNVAMRTANNNIEQAREQQKEAFTNYFPQVSGTGLYFHSSSDMIKGNIDVSGIAELLPAELLQTLPLEGLQGGIPMSMLDHGTIAGVMAMQPVFAGGQIINGNKLAKVGVEASEIQKSQSQNQVELTAEQYFWQVVTLQEKQKTINALSEMLKSIENDAQTAVDAGVALRNDLLQVQLKQNEVESNRIKVDNALNLCKTVLCQYIGMDQSLSGSLQLSLPEDISTLPSYPISLKQDAETAVLNTPEYQLLQKNVEAKSLQRKMEVGRNLPTVGVGVGYSYNNLSGTDNDFGMVFASVSVPISGWWGGSHAIKRKKLAEENAKDLLDDNTELLKIRAQKNWNDVDDAYKQLELAHKSIEQSEENLRLNRDQYQAGTSKMSDLLQAESLYQQARDQYTDAYSQLQTKMIEYRQAVGL